MVAIDGGHQRQPAAAVLLHVVDQHGIIDGQQQMLALFRLAGLAPGHQLRHQVARLEVGGLAIDVLHHQPLVIDEVGRGDQAVGFDKGGQRQPGMAGEEKVVEGLMEHPILAELIELGADQLAAKAGFAGHAGEGSLQLRLLALGDDLVLADQQHSAGQQCRQQGDGEQDDDEGRAEPKGAMFHGVLTCRYC